MKPFESNSGWFYVCTNVKKVNGNKIKCVVCVKCQTAEKMDKLQKNRKYFVFLCKGAHIIFNSPVPETNQRIPLYEWAMCRLQTDLD